MMVDLESEKIVKDDTKDLPIDDCQKHLAAALLTEVTGHEGEEAGTVWAGQVWKKYV